MHYRGKSAWTLILTAVMALLLTGCGVVPGASSSGDTLDQSTNPPNESGNVPSASVSPATPTPLPDIVDLDGDGLADTVNLENKSNVYDNGDGNLHISVILSSGREYEGNDFPGDWYNPVPIFADMDGDGRDDIILPLEYYGSNYGATDVYVLRVQDDALSLMSFGVNYIQNDAIAEEQPQSFYDYNYPCIGCSVISNDGVNLLRIRYLIDDDQNTAWYVDAQWNGEGWFITAMNQGAAYGEDEIFTRG